jgi:SET domain-containing protein
MKTFSQVINEEAESSMYTERGGLLRKTPVVKKWDKIGAGKSQIEGLGVWALEPLVDNETIEECPVIEVPRDQVAGTDLMDYLFKVDENSYVLALGNGSLYNHRNQPNARWHYDEDRKTLVFRATRAINAGEEIFISYGKDYWKTRDISMKGSINLTNTSKNR